MLASISCLRDYLGEQNERLDSSTNFSNDSFIRCPFWVSLLQPYEGNRMNTKPEALRLAEWLDTHSNGSMDVKHKAAAELRRQHEEIKCEERRFSDLWEQFAALDKVNQELVEALEEFLRNPAGDNTEDIARAALAKARGTE